MRCLADIDLSRNINAETAQSSRSATDRTITKPTSSALRQGRPNATPGLLGAVWVSTTWGMKVSTTSKMLSLFDEPSTGLGFYDVHKLLDEMRRLMHNSNSILVIKPNRA